MKRKDPAFLFYSEAFLVGTMDMSDEEVGQYIRLLCRQHQKGEINPRFIDDLSEAVKSKFVKNRNGNYYNKRLLSEIEKRAKYAESRRQNGSKGGRPKKHMDNNEKPYANHMQTICKPYENHTINKNQNKNKDINISNKEYEEDLRKDAEKRGLNMEMWEQLRNKEWA